MITKAKVQGHLILVSLPHPGLDMPGQDPLPDLDFHDCPDSRTVHGSAVPAQNQPDPVTTFSFIDEQFAGSAQVKVAVVVNVSPCRLIGGTKLPDTFRAGPVDKLPATLVAVENRVILDAPTTGSINGGKEQVQVAVVVVIGESRGSKGLLPGEARTAALVLKVIS